MMVTAPVGSYDVEIQNGDMKAVKKVTVRKDETTALDFSEYQTPATKKGTVNFQVTPANAVMTIDGSEVDYSKPVSLSYGRHSLVLQANHYTAYTETFVVNSDYTTKVIDMTSTSSSGTTSSTAKTTAASHTVSIPDTAGDMTYSFPAMTKVASSTEHTAAEPTASSSK